jgi:sulfide dehydrogenase cytochrome subunit
MSKTAMYTILLEYKNGKRTGTMMTKHAKGFSDAELEQISYYFSNVQR